MAEGGFILGTLNSVQALMETAEQRVIQQTRKQTFRAGHYS